MNPHLAELLPHAFIDRWEGRASVSFALSFPGRDLMNMPGMRHAPSYAFIVTELGQIWLLKAQGHAWIDGDLVRGSALLSQKLDKLDWGKLAYCLPSLDLPATIELLGPRLGGGLATNLVDKTRLTNALFSRWISQNSSLPTEVLKDIKEKLALYLEEQVGEAIAEYCRHVQERFGLDLEGAVDLDVLNALRGSFQTERNQFLATFPALGSSVYAHDANSFWRSLRQAIDGRKSPVKALSDAWDIKQSTVRSLRSTESHALGEYFAGHIEELCRLLDQVPPEHHPKTPAQWMAFRKCHATAKEVFGHSDAARLVIGAKVRHDLKRLANTTRDDGERFSLEEARAIERLRLGLINTVDFVAQQNAVVSGIEHVGRAEIHVQVDKFLSSLSWQRLVALTKKWEKALHVTVESKQVELEFVQSKSTYFDFLGETFTTSNGYRIETLTKVDALKAQGVEMRLCLREAGHRSEFSQECSAAKTTILSVRNPGGELQSTAELGIRLFTDAKKELAVQFRVIQHQGFENRVAPEGAKIALQETLAELSRPKLQMRAVEGVRLSAKRLQANKGGDKTDFTIAIAGLDAFHRTFGVKSTELWSRLEGRPGLDQKRPGA
jgi:hypothetical protein